MLISISVDRASSSQTPERMRAADGVDRSPPTLPGRDSRDIPPTPLSFPDSLGSGESSRASFFSEQIIYTYSDLQSIITEKQREFPGATFRIEHVRSNLLMVIENGCVIDVSRMPVEYDAEMELFVMWGRFALSTQNHPADLPIEVKMPSLRMPSRAAMFTLTCMLWFFAGSAAMKAFTAGLGIFIPYSEVGALVYAFLVTAVTAVFYKANLEDAQLELFADPRVLFAVLQTGSNRIHCQMAPPPLFYSLAATAQQRTFQVFSGIFHGAAQYGMVAAAWESLAEKGSIIPFGNPYFTYSIALTLILANVAVGFNKSTFVYRLLQRYFTKWFGQHSEASAATFKFTVLAMSQLDTVMIKGSQYFDLATLRSGLFARLQKLTHSLQGTPKLDALLAITEFYIEYLELATAVLSAMHKARPHIETKYSFKEIEALIKNVIFKESKIATYIELVNAQYGLIAKLKQWLESFKSLLTQPLPTVIVSTDVNGVAAPADTVGPAFFDVPLGIEGSDVLAWCKAYVLQSQAEVFIDGEAPSETQPLLIRSFKPPVAHRISVRIEEPVAGYWSTTMSELLGMVLAIIPVKPNIDGIASLLEKYFSTVIRYMIGIVGSVGPVGLNYESVMKMLMHETRLMNTLVYQQGRQPSSASKWLGRLLSFSASAVVYYSLTSYGLPLSFNFTRSQVSSPVFWLEAACVMISWWIIVDTKSAPLYKLFESLLQKMSCLKTAKFQDDQVLFHAYLIKKMGAQLRAIGELVGDFRSLNPDRMPLTRIVGEFASPVVMQNLRGDLTAEGDHRSQVNVSRGSGYTLVSLSAQLPPELGEADHGHARSLGYEWRNEEYVFNEDLFWRELNKAIKNDHGLKHNAKIIEKAYRTIQGFVNGATLLRAGTLVDNRKFGASFFRQPVKHVPAGDCGTVLSCHYSA